MSKTVYPLVVHREGDESMVPVVFEREERAAQAVYEISRTVPEQLSGCTVNYVERPLDGSAAAYEMNIEEREPCG